MRRVGPAGEALARYRLPEDEARGKLPLCKPPAWVFLPGSNSVRYVVRPRWRGRPAPVAKPPLKMIKIVEPLRMTAQVVEHH